MAKVGRPTKYKKEYAEMMIKFFDRPAKTEKEVVYTGKDGKQWSKMEEKPSDFPTFERFAHEIGVDDKTLERWFKAKRSSGSPQYPEFCRAYTRCKQLQKDILIQNGLTGDYSSNFAVFVAKNATDMRDKVEVPVDDQGNPVPFVSGFQFVVPKGSKEDETKTNDKTNN